MFITCHHNILGFPVHGRTILTYIALYCAYYCALYRDLYEDLYEEHNAYVESTGIIVHPT